MASPAREVIYKVIAIGLSIDGANAKLNFDREV
jgi:hypothetical protein